jgi:DegV family protein with EDD domain
MLGMFDTLKYMLRGGRISRTKATVASIIGVKPMLKFSQGTIVQAGLARTYKKGVEKLVDFVKAKKGILSLGIAHSAIPEEARKLKQRLGQFTREEEIVVTELGPALGVHGGPGVLLVAVQSE